MLAEPARPSHRGPGTRRAASAGAGGAHEPDAKRWTRELAFSELVFVSFLVVSLGPVESELVLRRALASQLDSLVELGLQPDLG